MSVNGKIIARYPYRDENKKLLYEVVRFEPKDFRPRQPMTGGRWNYSMQGVRRVLYRLPEIIAAPKERPIYLVEGEKDAKTLADLGLIATTIAGGANAKWTREIAEPLAGRTVIIVPDKDLPGYQYGHNAFVALRPLGCDVGWINLPDVGEKGDVSDYLATRSLHEFLKLPVQESCNRLAATPTASPASPLGSPLNVERFDIDRDLLKLETLQAVRIEWLWKHWLPKGKLCLLDGDPGLGKSFVTLDLAARLSRGDCFPDGGPAPSKPLSTLLVACEDGITDTTLPRLQLMNADLRYIRTWQGQRKDGQLHKLPHIPDDLPALEAMIQACDAKLVIIDPLMAFLSESVNSISDQSVRGVLTPMSAIAEKFGTTILFVRHLNKTNGKNAVYRGGGSIGITAAMRTAMLIGRHPHDRDQRVLAMVKTNIGPEPKSQGFRLASFSGDANGVAGEPAGLAAKRAFVDPDGRIVHWTGPVDLYANDLVGDVKEAQNPKEWLKAFLADGPRSATSVIQEAAAAGFSQNTIERAKAALSIVSRKKTKGREATWFWLPVGETKFQDDSSLKLDPLADLPPLDTRPERC